MVRRYELGERPYEDRPSLIEDEHGDWVRVEDYDALAAAARKVTCSYCDGEGRIDDGSAVDGEQHG